MEDITDPDFAHAKVVCKYFEIKNLRDRFQSDRFLLADVFENFRNICLKLQKLDPAKFLSVPKLDWQAPLKKSKAKLDLLTDINMLSMAGEGITGEICHYFYQYEKANNKCVIDCDKNKESSYLQYWDVNN